MGNRYDWDAIWADFKAGVVSIREISRKYGIDASYLCRKAKKLNIRRDLTEDVRQAAKVKLLETNVKPETKKALIKKNLEEREIAIVDEKSDELVQVQLLHRQDIKKLREAEQNLLHELMDKPKRLWIGQYQGKLIIHEFELTVTDRASALQSLANTMHKRILLERLAYSIDDSTKDEDRDLKASLTPEEKQMFRKAAKIISRKVIERTIDEHDQQNR